VKASLFLQPLLPPKRRGARPEIVGLHWRRGRSSKSPEVAGSWPDTHARTHARNVLQNYALLQPLAATAFPNHPPTDDQMTTSAAYLAKLSTPRVFARSGREGRSWAAAASRRLTLSARLGRDRHATGFGDARIKGLGREITDAYALVKDCYGESFLRGFRVKYLTDIVLEMRQNTPSCSPTAF